MPLSRHDVQSVDCHPVSSTLSSPRYCHSISSPVLPFDPLSVPLPRLSLRESRQGQTVSAFCLRARQSTPSPLLIPQNKTPQQQPTPPTCSSAYPARSCTAHTSSSARSFRHPAPLPLLVAPQAVDKATMVAAAKAETSSRRRITRESFTRRLCCGRSGWRLGSNQRFVLSLPSGDARRPTISPLLRIYRRMGPMALR